MSSIANVIVKVVNGVLLTQNTSVVTIPSGINDVTKYLVAYSNTALMLANDATTYANSVNYINSKLANVHVADLVDVTLSSNPPSNNSTLVYNTTNNKYIVQQMNLDGGNF